MLLAALFMPYVLETSIKFDTLLMYITLAQVLINGVLIMYFVKIVKEHDHALTAK